MPSLVSVDTCGAHTDKADMHNTHFKNNKIKGGRRNNLVSKVLALQAWRPESDLPEFIVKSWYGVTRL